MRALLLCIAVYAVLADPEREAPETMWCDTVHTEIENAAIVRGVDLSADGYIVSGFEDDAGLTVRLVPCPLPADEP